MEDAPPLGAMDEFGFSPLEVISAIRIQRVGVAPDRDGIHPMMFRKCMMTLLPWLNTCVQCLLVQWPLPQGAAHSESPGLAPTG